MFIRIKKIKKYKYAYRVKNKWTKKGARQKTVGYLGRVYELQASDSNNEENSFNIFIKIGLEQYLLASKPKDIVRDYIGYELHKHGFISDIKESSDYKDVWINKENITVNLNELTIKKGNANVVLHLNNDFLCEYSLKKLLNFRSKSDQEECGREFAQAFVSAGIPIEQKIFVEVFSKIFREGD